MVKRLLTEGSKRLWQKSRSPMTGRVVRWKSSCDVELGITRRRPRNTVIRSMTFSYAEGSDVDSSNDPIGTVKHGT